MKVIIHFGPPKTGTSAIQNWLLEHRELLIKYGIYYPNHILDSNGVSSGNALALFETPKSKIKDARQKKPILIEEARKHKCRTLLLSSESFMRRLPILARLFPKADFIGYVRPPYELLESGYNQRVKQGGEVDKFNLEQAKKINHLKKFGPMISEIGAEKFTLRPYEPSIFFKNDIICDFLETLIPNFNNEQELEPSKQINLSYTLEALELKRWLNSIELERPLLRKVHLVLQSIKEGTSNFSVLTKEEYEAQKSASIQDINDLNEICKIDNYAELINSIERKSQKTPMSQEINDKQKMDLLSVVAQRVPELTAALKEKGVNI
jgi:hypothetical protein